MGITSSRFRFRAPLLVAALCASVRAEPLPTDPEPSSPELSGTTIVEAPAHFARDLASFSPSEADAEQLRGLARAAAEAACGADRTTALAPFREYLALARHRPGSAPVPPGALFSWLAARILAEESLPAFEGAPRVAALAAALAASADEGNSLPATAREDAAFGLLAAAECLKGEGRGLEGLSLHLLDCAQRLCPENVSPAAESLAILLRERMPVRSEDEFLAALKSLPPVAPEMRYGFDLVAANELARNGDFDAASNAFEHARTTWLSIGRGETPPAGWFVARSNAHLAAGATNESERVLEEALAINRDPTLLNNLAYHLAETDGDLDRALALVDEALAARPLDAATLDTLGWILFKRGQPLDALEAFQRCLDQGGDGNDAEIMAHIDAVLQVLKKPPNPYEKE